VRSNYPLRFLESLLTYSHDIVAADDEDVVMLDAPLFSTDVAPNVWPSLPTALPRRLIGEDIEDILSYTLPDVGHATVTRPHHHDEIPMKLSKSVRVDGAESNKCLEQAVIRR